MSRWVRDHPLTTGFVVLFVYITIIGGLAYNSLADNDSQFCKVAAQRLIDKQIQIAQSEEYLSTAAGEERTGLNDYIRTASLPRLRAEVKSDQKTLPSSCRDEYDDLKH